MSTAGASRLAPGQAEEDPLKDEGLLEWIMWVATRAYEQGRLAHKLHLPKPYFVALLKEMAPYMRNYLMPPDYTSGYSIQFTGGRIDIVTTEDDWPTWEFRSAFG